VRPLDRLHVQVDCSRGGVFADGGIARVGKRAGLSVAEASDIVLVATECLLFCGPGEVRFEIEGEGEERT
jgi:hypothetical protein